MIYPSLEPETRIEVDGRLRLHELISMRVVASPVFMPLLLSPFTSSYQATSSCGTVPAKFVEDCGATALVPFAAPARCPLPPSKGVVLAVKTRARRFSAPRARRSAGELEPLEQERSCESIPTPVHLPISPAEAPQKITERIMSEIAQEFKDNPRFWFIQRLIPQGLCLLPMICATQLFAKQYICLQSAEFFTFYCLHSEQLGRELAPTSAPAFIFVNIERVLAKSKDAHRELTTYHSR